MNEQLMVRPVEVLTVDDNPADVRYLIESFRDLGLANQIASAPDGEACLQMLRRQGRYQDAARPDLVFLDTLMPKMDGHELYNEMKRDAALQDIPVVVLTGSRLETEVLKFQGLHPDCYIEKPLDAAHLEKAFQCFAQFSLYVVPVDKMAKLASDPPK